MRKNLHTQIPRYNPKSVTLANGVNVKAALEATSWGRTEISLGNGLVATIIPDIDEERKPGATNYYTIIVNGKTYNVNYLRQVVSYLSKYVNQDENPEKTIRTKLLEKFKSANWAPISWHRNGRDLTIIPVSKPEEKRISSYQIMNGSYTLAVNSLSELVAMLT